MTSRHKWMLHLQLLSSQTMGKARHSPSQIILGQRHMHRAAEQKPRSPTMKQNPKTHIDAMGHPDRQGRRVGSEVSHTILAATEPSAEDQNNN